MIGAIDVWQWAGTLFVAACAVWLLYTAARFLKRANQVLTPARVPVDHASVMGGFVGRREVDPADLTFHPSRHRYWVGYVLDDVDSDLRGFNYQPRASLPTATEYHPLDPEHQRAAAMLLEQAMVDGEPGALDPRVVGRLRSATHNRLARHLIEVYETQARKQRKTARAR